MKKIIILIALMLLSFFISGLFFLNSGMFDKQGEFNRARADEMVFELNKIPLINIGIEKGDYEGNIGES